MMNEALHQACRKFVDDWQNGVWNEEDDARELATLIEKVRPSREDEAWKVAQLAVMLRGARMALNEVESDLWCEMAVGSAKKYLAEARRQTAEPTP